MRAAVVLVLLAACGGDASHVRSDGGADDASTPGDDAGPAADGGTDAGADAGPLPDPSDEIYDPAALNRFDLDLPPESVDALWADPTTYVHATLRWGDEVVDDVGVRLKGEYNFRNLDGKAAFKIKIDEFVAEQTFHGLRRLTWNNALEDPSFVAERLVYEAFRAAGLPAPRANSAEVWVNGEPYGVYVNIETEDKTFLRRWFASDEGNLYEELGEELLPGNEYGWELETNEAADDRSDLTALFDAIETAGDETLLADLADVIDADRFLAYCAMEGIVNQWDGYAYTRFGPNNFRIYHDPSDGRWSFLPWGMDMAMKPFPSSGEADLPMDEPTGMLLQRCFGSATCRAAYDAKVDEMADGYDALDLELVADDAYDQVRDAVYADPRREVSTGTFEATFDAVREFARDRAGRL